MADKNNSQPNVNEQIKVRMDKLAALQEAGKDPFQITKYDVTASCAEAKAQYEKLEAELGDKVEVNMVEMGSDKTKFEGSMLDACESDADLIITGLWDMKEITEKVAQEFPEKKFIIFDTDVDYTIGDLSNVYSMSYKQNEGAFLAGVLAASATKSDMEYANEDNVIGFVGAKDTAAVINDSAVGFIEGAQFVDPDVKVLVSYVGSYVDSATAKELAITQYSNGADVVFVAAGPASVGVIEAAAESKKYCIGVDSDQSATIDDYKEDLTVTSAMKGLQVTIDNVLDAILDNEWDKYVGKIEKECEDSKIEKYSDNNILNILLIRKKKECEENGIKLNITSTNPKLDFIDGMDTVAIFSNLINNAIEACSSSARKDIFIDLYTVNNAFSVIKVENYADKEPIVVEGMLRSGKDDGNSHGIGIKSINNSLSKYDGKMSWSYDKAKGMFRTVISINNSQINI